MNSSKSVRFHLLLGPRLLNMDEIYSMRDFAEWLEEIDFAAREGKFDSLCPTDSGPAVVVDVERLYKKAKGTELSCISTTGVDFFYYPDNNDRIGIGVRRVKSLFNRKKAKRIIRVRRRVRRMLMEYAKPRTKANPFEAILELSLLRERLFQSL